MRNMSCMGEEVVNLVRQGSLDGAVWEKRALIGAKRLAHARWKESKEESPLFTDLFAPQLAATVSCPFATFGL